MKSDALSSISSSAPVDSPTLIIWIGDVGHQPVCSSDSHSGCPSRTLPVTPSSSVSKTALPTARADELERGHERDPAGEQRAERAREAVLRVVAG